MLLLAAILALTLQNSPQNQFGTIEGVVSFSSATGAPIEGARVQVSTIRLNQDSPPGFSAATTTDGYGHFKISDVPSGLYKIEIAREGLGWRDSSDAKFRTGVTVANGQLVRVPDVMLSPPAAIYGHVLDADGNGISSAEVEILRRNTDDLGRTIWFVMPGSLLTDERGAYRKTLFGSGDYVVRTVVEAGLVPLVVYYPGATESGDAAPVLLPEGSETVADIRIGSHLTDQRFEISGKVVVPPVEVESPFIELILTKRESGNAIEASPPSSFRTSTRASAGIASFDLRGVRLGDYDLSVSARINGSSYTAKASIEIRDRDIEMVELTLHPPVTVRGRLIVDGEPHDVQLSRRLTGGGFDGKPDGGHAAEVILSLSPQNNPSPQLVSPAIIDPSDNTFSFGEIPEGEYKIIANLRTDGTPSSQDLYVADIRAGGRSVMDSGIKVGLDDTDSVEIVVGTQTGSIEGRIAGSGTNLPAAGNEIAPAAALVVIPETSRRNSASFYRITTVLRDGNFLVSGIPPGNYKVFAVPQRNEPIPYARPEFIRQYESRALSVTIQKGTTSGSLQVPYLDK